MRITKKRSFWNVYYNKNNYQFFINIMKYKVCLPNIFYIYIHTQSSSSKLKNWSITSTIVAAALEWCIWCRALKPIRRGNLCKWTWWIDLLKIGEYNEPPSHVEKPSIQSQSKGEIKLWPHCWHLAGSRQIQERTIWPTGQCKRSLVAFSQQTIDEKQISSCINSRSSIVQYIFRLDI